MTRRANALDSNELIKNEESNETATLFKTAIMKNCYRLCIVFVLKAIFTNVGASVRTRQVNAGSTIRLRCESTVTSDTDGLVWNVPGSLGESRRVQRTPSRVENKDGNELYKSSIRVQNATPEDTGLYGCMYHKVSESGNATSNQRSTSDEEVWVKKIYVYVYDKSSLLLSVRPTVNVELGKDLILPCRVTNEQASVNFAKIPSMKFSNVQRVKYDRNLGFVISNATYHDAGLWKCEANLNKLTGVKRFLVNVVRPQVKALLDDVEVLSDSNRYIQNDTIEVTCQVPITRGSRVKFVWKAPRNNTDVEINFGYEPIINEGNQNNMYNGAKMAWSKYLIPRAILTDTGYYECTVISNIETKSSDTNIVVYEAPFIDVISQPAALNSSAVYTSYVAREETVELVYKVDALPKPKFQWFKGSTFVSETSYYEGMPQLHWEVQDSKFVISNVTFADSGVYTLLIKTDYETRNESVEVVVMDRMPAEIIDMEHSTVAKLGKNYTITCLAIGIPVPDVRWYHNDKILEETSDVLYIPRLISSDEGNYTCEVINNLGSDRQSFLLTISDPIKAQVATMVVIISILLAGVLCFVSLLICKINKVKKLKHQLNLEQKYLVPIINPKEMPLEEQAHCLEYDPKKWEFPRDRLRFGKTLGRGAFGKVVQATAFDLEKRSSCKTIAVKMLKVGSRRSEYGALMSELKILIHLGPHLNIVNLLGACTTKDGPLMILVEYCRHGNLSVYLKGMRDNYVGSRSSDNETKKVRLMSDDSTDDCAFSAVDDETDRSSWVTDKRASRTSCGSAGESIASNDCDRAETARYSGEYEDSRMSMRKDSEENEDEHKDKRDKKNTLTLTDLLSYSLQVSRGMEFLASKKCIHRDLAARNVLLSDYQVVKICDFGLARDVYKDPDYVRSGDARLPLKWMAPESIFDKVYTTKSDVWSFGVLLWEIFTLGGSPYPGLQIDEDFCNKLRRGVRMSKPRYATDSVYSAMLACWANSPKERPTFTKLCEELSDVLQAEAGHEYLDIMKIFQTSSEGKLPLRGVQPQETPKETFDEVKIKLSDEAHCSSTVNYTDVEVGLLRKMDQNTSDNEKCDKVAAENEDSFDSVIEVTQESIVLDHLTPNPGYLSEDSGMCGNSSGNLLYVDTSSFRSIDTCSSSCEAPPLYDDVIASRQ